MSTVTAPNLFAVIRRGHMREIGPPTLFAAVVLLLSAIMLFGANFSRFRESVAWVQRTNAMLLQIAEVDAKLVGVEMTVRGYALTDDPAFLVYQQHERSRLKIAMNRLAAQVAAEDSQKDRFARLRGFVAKRLALYTHLSGLGPGHAHDVAAAITDPGKRNDMISARQILNTLRDEELTLLAQRQTMEEQQASRAFWLAIGIVLAAFLLGGLGLMASNFWRTRPAT